MHTVCAWCGAQGDDVASGPISHGICSDCAASFEYERQTLESFLASLPSGTVAFDANARVVEANDAFLELVGRNREVLGSLGGEMISCYYATLPGGCGKTRHCVGCTIRGAIERTHRTGIAEVGTLAFALLHGTRGVVRTWFRVSTQPLGALVLLRIDDAGIVEPATDEAHPAGEPDDHVTGR